MTTEYSLPRSDPAARNRNLALVALVLSVAGLVIAPVTTPFGDSTHYVASLVALPCMGAGRSIGIVAKKQSNRIRDSLELMRFSRFPDGRVRAIWAIILASGPLVLSAVVLVAILLWTLWVFALVGVFVAAIAAVH